MSVNERLQNRFGQHRTQAPIFEEKPRPALFDEQRFRKFVVEAKRAASIITHAADEYLKTHDG